MHVCAMFIGTGNTGDKLSNDPDLYISRDGGVTWEEILAGSWGVNVADHGGLMVAAKDYHEEQSMVLKYSCDEGYSWKDFMFIDVSPTRELNYTHCIYIVYMLYMKSTQTK